MVVEVWKEWDVHRGVWTRGVLAVALLVGCATAPPNRTEVLKRSPRLPEVLAHGFAMAPVGQLQPGADTAGAAAELSNALYIESMTQLRGVDVVSPDLVLDRLGSGGDVELERFRQLRRRLVRDDRIPPDLPAALRPVVRERFLLVAWADEKKLVGLEDMGGDYVDAGYSLDVQRARYSQIDGVLVACLVDLESAEILWKGSAAYRSGRDFGGQEGTKSGEQISRESGAYELIRLLH